MWRGFLSLCLKKEWREGAFVDVKLKDKVEECRKVIDSKNYANITHQFGNLQEDLKEVLIHIREFQVRQSAASKVFKFWMHYSSMVNLLLTFIHAERTGNWELHPSTVAAMKPHFFAMDRQNYA